MADPLLTADEARKRASELLHTFRRDPDVLSPDEQALAMELDTYMRRWKEMIELYRDDPHFAAKFYSEPRTEAKG